eukprot:1192059-Prorocentrum_minimum.AAC.1
MNGAGWATRAAHRVEGVQRGANSEARGANYYRLGGKAGRKFRGEGAKLLPFGLGGGVRGALGGGRASRGYHNKREDIAIGGYRDRNSVCGVVTLYIIHVNYGAECARSPALTRAAHSRAASAPAVV